MVKNLVAQNNQFCSIGHSFQLVDILATEYSSDWILGIVDNDHFGLRSNQLLNLVPVDPEIRHFKIYKNRTPAIQFNKWGIRLLNRFKYNHFVTFFHEGTDG